MFSCEIHEIFKNTYFEEHLRTTVSGGIASSCENVGPSFLILEILYENLGENLFLGARHSRGIETNYLAIIISSSVAGSIFCLDFIVRFEKGVCEPGDNVISIIVILFLLLEFFDAPFTIVLYQENNLCA